MPTPARRARCAPARALHLGHPCTGCGRCAAACPAGALEAPGFVTAARAAALDTLRVDCEQVSPLAGDQAALRVPCLAGLSVGRVLALCAAAPSATVVLLDRGGCAGCLNARGDGSLGGRFDAGLEAGLDADTPAHPAAAAVQEAAALMREAGVPESHLPRLERRAARGWFAPRVEPVHAERSTRRRFFSRLARPREEPPAAPRPRDTRPSSERARLIESITALAARHGGRVPARLFPRLEAGPACDDAQVCAAACSTGALQRHGAGAVRGIAFDAALCIACGDCTAACPRQALRLLPGTALAAPSGPQPITRFAARECTDCGAHFAVRAGDDTTRCAACSKSAALARSAFQRLAAPRRAA